MQVLAIDDEKIALEGLTDIIKKALPDAEVFPYRNALKAVEELENKHIDIAFLDIEMRDINGLQFVGTIPSIVAESRYGVGVLIEVFDASIIGCSIISGILWPVGVVCCKCDS